MTYLTVLNALADPTRREIVECLRQGPQNVATLAAQLPVSRPAVSQHLKILTDAGLLSITPDGTQRIYRLQPDGLMELREYLDDLWNCALGAFAEFVEKEHQMIDPIKKKLTVNVSPQRAFDVFTKEIGKWWPLDTHSASAGAGATAKNLFIEPKVGGRIVEEMHDREISIWGEITIWRPGTKLEFTWHVQRPKSEQTIVTIDFLKNKLGTDIHLTHSGWDARVAEAASDREQYFSGWDYVFGECFGAALIP